MKTPPRARAALIVLSTAIMICALTAGSADAEEWFVNGKALLTGEAAAVSSSSMLTPAKSPGLVMPSLGMALGCTGGVVEKKAEVIGKNTIKTEGITFEGCSVAQPESGCTLLENTIRTAPLQGTLAKAASPLDKITFAPQTKTQLAEISFSETNTCALSGNQPVKGKIAVLAVTGQVESEIQDIEGLGSSENNSLEVGTGNKAFLYGGGRALVTLASHVNWSFH
jgi:hypothetical protein